MKRFFILLSISLLALIACVKGDGGAESPKSYTIDARAMDGVAAATDYFSSAFIRLRTAAGSSSDDGGDLSFSGTKWVTMKHSIVREDLLGFGLNISVKRKDLDKIPEFENVLKEEEK